MHALAREPSFRPVSAADFAQELAAGAAGAPTEARRTMPSAARPPTRSHRSVRRKRRRLLVAGAAALALAAAIFALIGRDDGGTSSSAPQTAPISSPARGATPADQARNLSTWLRAHSR
jgi:hypothetical protein